MERRRIWEIGCFGMDSVLSTSFDPDELLNVDPAFRCVYEFPKVPGAPIPKDDVVYVLAHQACHHKGTAALRIEKRLNAMHASLINSFDDMNESHVMYCCYKASSEMNDDLGGYLWVALSDPRPKLKPQALAWAHGLVLQAMRFWMRNKRSGLHSGFPYERE